MVFVCHLHDDRHIPFSYKPLLLAKNIIISLCLVIGQTSSINQLSVKSQIGQLAN